MTNMNNQRDLAAKAVKATSAQRLVALLEAAYRSGRLKPINAAAKPQTFEIRVKSKADMGSG